MSRAARQSRYVPREPIHGDGVSMMARRLALRPGPWHNMPVTCLTRPPPEATSAPSPVPAVEAVPIRGKSRATGACRICGDKLPMHTGRGRQFVVCPTGPCRAKQIQHWQVKGKT